MKLPLTDELYGYLVVGRSESTKKKMALLGRRNFSVGELASFFNTYNIKRIIYMNRGKRD